MLRSSGSDHRAPLRPNYQQRKWAALPVTPRLLAAPVLFCHEENVLTLIRFDHLGMHFPQMGERNINNPVLRSRLQRRATRALQNPVKFAFGHVHTSFRRQC